MTNQYIALRALREALRDRCVVLSAFEPTTLQWHSLKPWREAQRTAGWGLRALG